MQVREKEKQEQVDCLASSQFSTIRLRQIILAVKQEYNCKNHPKIIFVSINVDVRDWITVKTEKLAVAMELLKDVSQVTDSETLISHTQSKCLW